jgi:crotonobetainyl-CoA:carnitine CoA-transferase CaiB-like acyl-CoA transferase
VGEALDEPRLGRFGDKDAWSRQDEITELIAERLKMATTAEWCARMEPMRIWHAPVQGYQQIAEDPQVRHMRSLVTVPGRGEAGAPLTLLNHPVLYDGAAAQVRLPPQPLGAQTGEVLKEIGLADAEIAALAEAGVIMLRDR